MTAPSECNAHGNAWCYGRPMTPVGELPVGARFRWQGEVYRVTAHGPNATDAGPLLIRRDEEVEPLGPKTFEEALAELRAMAVHGEDDIQVDSVGCPGLLGFSNSCACALLEEGDQSPYVEVLASDHLSADELEQRAAALARVAKATRILEEVGK
jgi:hypothetical protein